MNSQQVTLELRKGLASEWFSVNVYITMFF